MARFTETAILDYRLRLPTKENKLPFSVSVCSERLEVYRFRLPLAANKQKLPFSFHSVFHLRIPET
jgi:hypothetical protein